MSPIKFIAVSFLLLSASVNAQHARAQIAAGASSRSEQADLETLVDGTMGTSLPSMVEQSVTMLRRQMASNTQWQDAERHYPGIIELRLSAFRTAALGGLPEMVANLRASIRNRWIQASQPAQRATFAAYLRTSYPQRVIRAVIQAHPGDTVVGALARTSAEIEASMSPEERQREAAFNASSTGRAYGRLWHEIHAESDNEMSSAMGNVIHGALMTGTNAAQAFIDGRSPATQPKH